MSDPMKEYEKLKSDMMALRAGLADKLAQELKAAGKTLTVLKEMGGDIEALASAAVSEVLAQFVPKNGKKSKSTGSKRFSAKKAVKILNGGQMSIADLAKALGLAADVVKANVENLSKQFTLTGDKVKAK